MTLTPEEARAQTVRFRESLKLAAEYAGKAAIAMEGACDEAKTLGWNPEYCAKLRTLNVQLEGIERAIRTHAITAGNPAT